MVDYTNLTPKIGDLDMPYIRCKEVPTIDFIAEYNQPSLYFKTPSTALGFFEYDICFDGLYGLWSAIYYGVKELQDFYRERFKGLRYIITPDVSKCGDNCVEENNYRHFKMRIFSVWLTMNTDAIVIPLVSCANDIDMQHMLDGMEDCNVVAVNAKGPMGDPKQMEVFLKMIKYTVDNLPDLKSIIVNTASPDKAKVLKCFKYAIDKGIDIQIPDNQLLLRNRLIGGNKNGVN